MHKTLLWASLSLAVLIGMFFFFLREEAHFLPTIDIREVSYDRQSARLSIRGELRFPASERRDVVLRLIGEGQLEREQSIAQEKIDVSFDQLAPSPHPYRLVFLHQGEKICEIFHPVPEREVDGSSRKALVVPRTLDYATKKGAGEKEGTRFFVERMPGIAASLDSAVLKLRTHRDKAETAMVEFYGKWYADHRSLQSFESTQDPLLGERLKIFYALSRELADVLLEQYNRVEEQKRPDYLNYVSAEQLAYLGNLVLRIDLLIAEFHPKMKRKSSFPYLTEWLKAVTFLYGRKVMLDNARAYRRRNQIPQAMHECKRVLEIHPEDCEVLLEMALLHCYTKSFGRAKENIELARKVAQEKGQDAAWSKKCKKIEKALMEEANEHFKRKEYPPADTIWRFLIGLNPNQEEAKKKLRDVRKHLKH